MIIMEEGREGLGRIVMPYKEQHSHTEPYLGLVKANLGRLDRVAWSNATADFLRDFEEFHDSGSEVSVYIPADDYMSMSKDSDISPAQEWVRTLSLNREIRPLGIELEHILTTTLPGQYDMPSEIIAQIQPLGLDDSMGVAVYSEGNPRAIKFYAYGSSDLVDHMKGGMHPHGPIARVFFNYKRPENV